MSSEPQPDYPLVSADLAPPGISELSPGLPSPADNEAVAFLLWAFDGKGAKEVAELVGVSWRTIYSWRQKYQWDQRKAAITEHLLVGARLDGYKQLATDGPAVLSALRRVAETHVDKQPFASIKAVELYAQIMGFLAQPGGTRVALPPAPPAPPDAIPPGGIHLTDARSLALIATDPGERDRLIARYMQDTYDESQVERTAKRSGR